MTTVERNHTIDILRGVTILLVVFGHVTRTALINQYIWSFHIPVFFVISGYLYYPEKFSLFSEFFKKKFRGLTVPYLIFGFLTFLYWLLIESRFRGTDLNGWEQLIGLFYGSRYKSFLEFNGPLWFIPCLFSMEVLFYFIEKMKKPLVILSACLILFIFGVFSKDICPWLPFGLCAALIGIIFYGAGYLLHCYSSFYVIKEQIISNKLTAIIFIIVLLAIQIIVVPYSNANLARLETGNPLVYLCLACLGVFIYWLISVLIGKSKLLEWLGINSLVIFALHGPIYRALVYIASYVSKMEVLTVRHNIMFCFVISVLTIVMVIPFIWVWNKWYKLFLK